MTFKIGDYLLFKYNNMLSLLRVTYEDETTYYIDIIYSNYGVNYDLKTDKGFALDKSSGFGNFNLADQKTIDTYCKLAVFK